MLSSHEMLPSHREEEAFDDTDHFHPFVKAITAHQAKAVDRHPTW
jgi:hypothetical protein